METKIKNQQLLVEALTNIFLVGLREIVATSSQRMSEKILTLRRDRFKELIKIVGERK